MNPIRILYIKLVPAILFLLVLPVVISAGTPKDISGLVNETRAKVTGVGAGFVFVDDVSGFTAGDTVLVIQMKGDGILKTNDTDFGKHQTHVGDVGYYEFILIQLVEVGPKKITFFNDLKGVYDASSSVQIVKVESYETLNVIGELTCPPWNSTAGTGGVMAIFASDKIILNANISVSGKGFKGASGVAIDGTCLESSPYVAFFNDVTTRAGRKGEGYASHDGAGTPLNLSLYTKGRGAIGTGGGGGDGALSGGGGGASYGYGGVGGEESGCLLPNPGGAGGYILNGYYNIATNLIYSAVIMGGGGGASGYTSGSAPDGGNGGGIIFIMTDSIYGNGYSIEANGSSVTVPSSFTSGGAGGGAAGTVVISANGYGTSGLSLEVKGGNGGDTPFGVGNGGGGSGGLIWVSPASYTNISFDKSGGLSGNYSGISASDGDPGPAQRTNLQMRLNGFLFNTIVTARDGNPLDSICYNQVPRALKASVPVGGTLPFTISWEKSYNGIDSWVPIVGNLSGNIFTPTQPETSTLWIRRKIVDNSSPTPITDISKRVKVIVHPLITDFAIGHDTGDTICFNQDPTLIEPLVPTPGGGNNFYIYKWHESATGVSYNQTLLSGLPTFNPPPLSADRWYRRTVYSGACVDSSSFVKIKVLPSIGSNIVGVTDTICEGVSFTNLTGPSVTGGDGIYRYKWEASLDKSDWTHTIEGTTDQAIYNPDETSADFPSVNAKYFRRIVTSGEDDCCTATSPTINLVMQPRIANNGLSLLSQIVCEKDPVVNEVIGTDPIGGDNTYTYMWQESVESGPWTDLPDSTRKDFSPYSLSLSTTYRRIVYSGVCEDISADEFFIVVQPILEGNTITTLSSTIDTIICEGDDGPVLSSPDMVGGIGSYTYLWEDSTSGHDWLPAPELKTEKNYDPGILTETTWYRRVVESGTCDSISVSFKITVLPKITGNTISASQDICYDTAPALFTGSSPVSGLGGGDGIYTYHWQWDADPAFTSPVDVGLDTDINYQAVSLVSPTYFRRIVYSGLNNCCKDTSNIITIGINPLPVALITTAQNEAICQGEDISLSLSVTVGAAPYSVILNDGFSDLSPLSVSSAGTHSHPLTPAFSTDKLLNYTLVSVVDANGCIATNKSGTKAVSLYEMPDANAGAPDEWCGFTGTLDATASVGVGIWYWDGPSTIFSEEDNPKSALTFSNFNPGDTILPLWWKEVNVLARCVDSASTTIRLWKPPTTAVSGSDSTLLPFQVDMRLYANNPVYGIGEWNIISGGGIMKTGDKNNPAGMVQGLSDGLNLLEWRISNGDVCLDSFDEVELTVPEVRLITGFTPDNDGINDFFVIDGLVEWDGGIVDNELVVTDLTGVIIYRKKNYGNDWDGRDLRGNPLPSGTYYYFINVYYSTTVQLKNFVIIKRD